MKIFFDESDGIPEVDGKKHQQIQRQYPDEERLIEAEIAQQ